MKKSNTKTCMLLGLIILAGCEKNEESFQQSANIELQAATEPLPGVKVQNYFGKYFEALDTVCGPYLRYTTKMDIASIPNESFVDNLSDGKLTITFEGYGTPYKLGPTTTDWWANWNVSPYVESANPDILRMYDWETITLNLSKKCYVFGFELSALLNINSDNPIEFGSSYSDTDRLPDDTPIGRLRQVVKSPAGARLFAVKSEIPFNKVVIYWNGSSATFTRAYALTNIRYLTSKKVFNQHKN